MKDWVNTEIKSWVCMIGILFLLVAIVKEVQTFFGFDLRMWLIGGIMGWFAMPEFRKYFNERAKKRKIEFGR